MDQTASYVVGILMAVGLIALLMVLLTRPRMARWLRLLAATRYSLLLALLPPVLVPVSLLVIPSLLANLFVLSGGVQMFNVTWLSGLVTLAALVTFRVTHLNAATRFTDYALALEGDPPPGFVFRPDQWNGWRVRWVVLALLALPVPVTALVMSWPEPDPADTWKLAAGFAAGVAGFFLLLFVLVIAERLLLHPSVLSPHLLPFDHLPWVNRVGARPLTLLHPLGNLLARLLNHLGPGYADLKPDPQTQATVGWLRPGHAQLFLSLALLVIVYVVSYIVTMLSGWVVGEEWYFPALFYVLFLILLIGLFLGGLGFLLDYYRFPPLLAFVLFSALLYTVSPTDHVYQTHEEPEDDNPLYLVDAFKPREDKVPFTKTRQRLLTESTTSGMVEQRAALRGRLKAMEERVTANPSADENPRTLVVVTAAGGGIQASAWSARVLAELHGLYGAPFTRSIGLISAVSGGSVGTLYYLDNWEPPGPGESPENYDPFRNPDALKKIIRAAEGSGLEAVGWGTTHSDLIRIAFPPLLYNRRHDRGWSLEQDWRSRLNAPDARLSDWRKRNRAGTLPVAVFNATLVESGQRFLISPVLSEKRDGYTPSPSEEQEFLALYPGRDLDLVTAARLSATFAFVTPISRRESLGEFKPEDYHVADGGYVDNEGLFTAIEFIRILIDKDAWPSDKRRPFDRILLVRIQPFPVGRAPESAHKASWLSAATGPIALLNQVRITSQAERNDFLVAQMKLAIPAKVLSDTEGRIDRLHEARRARSLDKAAIESAARNIEKSMNIDVVAVQFVFNPPTDSEEPPLSWKLSKHQKQRLDAAWDRIKQEGDPKNPIQDSPLAVLDQYFTRVPVPSP